MKHIFDVDVARSYGIGVGIIMENFHYWMVKNKANKKNYRDGRYWTYNSLGGLAQVFPYWSVDQIHRLVKKMAQEDLVLIGNYNRHKFDRTNWYSLTEKALELLDSPILEEGEKEGATGGNGPGERPMTIPYIKTDRKKDTSSAVFSSYKRDFASLDMRKVDSLKKHIERHGEEKVLRAMDLARKKGTRHLGYVAGILRNWEKEGGRDEGGSGQDQGEDDWGLKL